MINPQTVNAPLQSRRHMEMMDAMGLEDAEEGEVLPISKDLPIYVIYKIYIYIYITYMQVYINE